MEAIILQLEDNFRKQLVAEVIKKFDINKTFVLSDDVQLCINEHKAINIVYTNRRRLIYDFTTTEMVEIFCKLNNNNLSNDGKY